jgi:hypothetical protein
VFKNWEELQKEVSMKKLFLVLMVLTSLPAQAAGAGASFAQGQNHFSLAAGNSYAFDNNYFVFGVSATHYVIDGLGVGLSVDHWSGSGPSITRYSPYVQYVYFQGSFLQPYVGGFYRHTSISGLPGLYSYGGRAGVYIASGRNAYLSAGFVHETYIDCQEKTYGTCSETYPDIRLTFAF